jgi:hypothetical protein
MENAASQQKITYDHPDAINEIRDIVLETGKSKEARIAILKKVTDRFGFISNLPSRRSAVKHRFQLQKFFR